MKHPLLFLCSGALLLSMALPVFATERADIEAGLHALPLLTTKITGDITMAVVYDPGNPASLQDAQSVKAMADKGLEVPGGNKLSALLVSVDELGKLSRAKVAYLTPGLSSHLEDISIATSAASILTFSTDIDCVRIAKCIIGVVTSPTMSIYYSKAAAEAAKIEFSQAFTMIVKQP